MIDLEDAVACAHACSSQIQNAFFGFLWSEKNNSDAQREKLAEHFLGFLLDGEEPYLWRKQALQSETERCVARLQRHQHERGGLEKEERQQKVNEAWKYIMNPSSVLERAGERMQEMKKMYEKMSHMDLQSPLGRNKP